MSLADIDLTRSIFFTYDRPGPILDDARGKVSIKLRGWKDGGRWGKLGAIQCSNKLSTTPLKFYTPVFVEALRPALGTVVIDEQEFADFLNEETAENKSWTLRFWEIKYQEGWCRTITVGKDIPDIAKAVVVAMNKEARGTSWAGAEFTHDRFGVRVMVHRYPTAAIAPWGIETPAYLKVRDRFIKFLRKMI